MKSKLIIPLILASLFSIQANAKTIAEKFDFSFTIEKVKGASNFAPIQAFTDGKKTWLHFKSPDNTPAIFYEDKPLSYKTEFPYLIVDGVYQNLSVILAGEKVAGIEYSGRYSMDVVGSAFSVKSPSAINDPAPMPVAIELKKEPEIIEKVIVEKAIEPVSEIKITKTEDATGIVEVNLSPVLGDIKFERTISINAEPIEPLKKVEVSETVNEVPEPIFVAYPNKLTDEDIDKIKEWVNAGGTITLIGGSGKPSKSARKTSETRRVNEAKKTLISKGINKRVIKIGKSDGKSGPSGANVIFNLGV